MWSQVDTRPALVLALIGLRQAMNDANIPDKPLSCDHHVP